MKNISDFNSFVQAINEAAPWDPKKAQTAIDDIMKRYKENKDAEPTGLSFANIQKVYGKIDNRTRFEIAQALKLIGKNFFPVNSSHPDQSANDRFENSKGDSSDFFFTYYVGEKNQNLKMDKFSEALLKAVKPVVDNFKGNFDQFIEKIALENPVVKQAKVAADKIAG